MNIGDQRVTDSLTRRWMRKMKWNLRSTIVRLTTLEVSDQDDRTG